jgi:hypothetical protein
MRGALIRRFLPAWAVALLALGCSEGTDAPSGDDACARDEARCAPVEGGMEIGTGGPSGFRAFGADEPSELVLGPQGGYMILPEFRIDASIVGTDGTGARFSVAAVVEPFDPDAEAPLEVPTLSGRLPSLYSDGTYFYVDALPLFLSTVHAEVAGRACTITAAFRDDGLRASATARVLLVDDQ